MRNEVRVWYKNRKLRVCRNIPKEGNMGIDEREFQLLGASRADYVDPQPLTFEKVKEIIDQSHRELADKFATMLAETEERINGRLDVEVYKRRELKVKVNEDLTLLKRVVNSIPR